MNQKDVNNKHFISIIKNYNRNRLVITTVVLLTFLVIMVQIGVAIVSPENEMVMSQEWKEILLLVLGAFIASYTKIIDYWFNNTERDVELLRRADDDYVPHNNKVSDNYDPCEDCPGYNSENIG